MQVLLDKDFWKRVDKTTSCWIYHGPINNKGYGLFGNIYAHRKAWMLAYGEVPGRLWVLHKCDVPLCVNPEHLFLGDVFDNNQDMSRKGRHGSTKNPWLRRGKNNGKSILREDQALEIIRNYKPYSKYNSNFFARKFEVSRSAIANVIYGNSWNWLRETNAKVLPVGGACLSCGCDIPWDNHGEYDRGHITLQNILDAAKIEGLDPDDVVNNIENSYARFVDHDFVDVDDADQNSADEAN